MVRKDGESILEVDVVLKDIFSGKLEEKN